MSKTMLWPSGEISREIQVPLVVVNSWVRVAFSGRVCGGVAGPPAAGAPCRASAAAEKVENARTRQERSRRLSIGRVQGEERRVGDRRRRQEKEYDGWEVVG